jgi:hypothetical protein
MYLQKSQKKLKRNYWQPLLILCISFKATFSIQEHAGEG